MEREREAPSSCKTGQPCHDDHRRGWDRAPRPVCCDPAAWTDFDRTGKKYPEFYAESDRMAGSVV